MQKGIGAIITLVGGILLACALGGGFLLYQNYSKSQIQKSIVDFDSCVKAGNPMTASYPGICRTSDGRSFVQPLTDEEKKKLIPPSTEPSIQETTNEKTYKDTNITFNYPSNINLHKNNEEVYLELWGPTQKKDTEFYDGINFGFTKGELEGKSLKVVVEQAIERSKENGEILIPLTNVKLAGVEGYKYRAQGLGEVEYTFLPMKNSYLIIRNTTNDPTNKGFQETVDQILQTLKLL